VKKRQFGVSTHLFHAQRLCRAHLLDIAAHGFETVEVFATRSHFDYHNPAVVADVQEWLAEAGLTLSSIHAPAGPVGAVTPEQNEAALFVARRIPVAVFVMHFEGRRDRARKNVERFAELAVPLGVTIAIEVPEHSPPGSAVHIIEEEIEARVGIALDCARADRDGDLIDAIEVVAEHLAAVRVPIESGIDWASTLTTVQKIGYDGPLIFDGSARGSTKEALARARLARQRMEGLMVDG
jgi:sugar phosphate isomerase/epimerase